MLFINTQNLIVRRWKLARVTVRKPARTLYRALVKNWRQAIFRSKIYFLSFSANNSTAKAKLASLKPPKGSYRCTRDWVIEHELFKANIDTKFFPIEDGKRVVLDGVPQALEEQRNRLFEVRARIYHLNELFVVNIKKGKVWARYGTIITPDNCLLEDLSQDFSRSFKYGKRPHIAFRDWRVTSVQHIPGRVAAITFPAGNIYGHWLHDILPRFELLRRAGYQLEDFDKFILCDVQKSFQKEALAKLGIPASKIIEAKNDALIEADELVVPSLLKESLTFRKWAAPFLCDLFDNKANQGINSPNVATYPRIYICRGQAKVRRVLNEDAVIECLKPFGFKPIKLEDYSVSEQKDLLSHAEVIVAPHGSGLANLVFCQPETKVIEIFPPELVAQEFCRLSLLMNLDYYYVFGQGKMVNEWGKNRWADILVDLEALQMILSMAGVN